MLNNSLLGKRMLVLSALLAQITFAGVTHTSTTRNLRVPKGTYTQFRTIGEGTNDVNLQFNITHVAWSVQVESQFVKELNDSQSTKYPFNLFVFDDEIDYNCYVEGVALFNQGVNKTCYFT